MTTGRDPQHDWQCGFHFEQDPAECCCGVTAPRQWWMDCWPRDRAPTWDEINDALACMARIHPSPCPPEDGLFLRLRG